MRFNSTLKVDFTKWTQVKMERENNMREYKGIEEDQPKYFRSWHKTQSILFYYALGLEQVLSSDEKRKKKPDARNWA